MVAYVSGPSVGQGSVFAKADAPVFIPEIWEATLMRYRYRMMELMRYVDVMPFAGNRGDTIKRPFIGRLRSRRKVAGAPLIFEAKREGEWKMQVDRYSYTAMSIDAKLKFFSQVDLARAYAPEMMRALMEDIEYSLLAERAVFAGYSVDSRMTSSDPLSFADILEGYQTMLERDVPVNELVLHIGPRQYVTLFTIPEFIQNGVFNSGNIASIPNGAIVGNIMGIPIVMNHSIRRNQPADGDAPLVLGGDDYEDIEKGEKVATPGAEANGYYWPTQWGDDQNNITPQALPTDYVSALLTTRSSIKLAMAMRPRATSWFSDDYQEDRYAALQMFDIKVGTPKEGIIISTDEYGLIA